MSNIQTFKMINGEEVIGEVVEELAHAFEMHKPANIMLQQTEEGVGVAVAPFMPYSQGNPLLYKSAVQAQATPDDNMVNEYNRIFGSGIEIVPSSRLQTM
jgi:hypothetical protein